MNYIFALAYHMLILQFLSSLRLPTPANNNYATFEKMFDSSVPYPDPDPDPSIIMQK
jgi:hypothetical protein